MSRRAVVVACAASLAFACSGPSNKAETTTPPCDQRCKDDTAARSLRETVKLVFNMTLQGKRVGTYDLTAPCPGGGSARVVGTATANALVGANQVKLSYTLDACTYELRDSDPKHNYRMTLTGTISQEGVIAVQPTATTALVMKSDAMTFSGTIYEPEIPYDERDCVVSFGQQGGQLFGKICGRDTTISL